MNRPSHRARLWLALAAILACRLLLGVLFSVNTPLWEAYDETGHYAYARYLATERRLPPLGVKLVDFDETHQPPLYYALIALPMVFVPEDHLTPIFTAGGRTWVVPAAEDRFPWYGTALALRLGRFASLLVSMLGVVFVFLALRALLPAQERAALIGAFFMAFWPQFVFQSGTISNDVGMVVVGAAVLWGAARLVSVSPARLSDWVVIGAVAGLATWVKANGIALTAAALGVVAVLAVRRRAFISGGVSLLVCVVVIVLGALISEERSLRWAGLTTAALEASGEAFSLEPLASATDAVSRVTDVLRRGAWLGFSSMFAAYSWGTLQPPQSWLWLAAGAAGVVFLLGLLAPSTRAVNQARALAAWVWAAVAVMPIARASFADEPSLLSGRFFLPALPALSVWAALGLAVLSLRPRLWIGGAAFIGLPFVSLVSPWLVLAPAYKPPSALSPEQSSQQVEIKTSLEYGGALRLLGYRTLTPKVEAGGEAALEVHWQVLRPTERGYGVQLEVFNCLGESMQIRHRQTLGNNTLPTCACPLDSCLLMSIASNSTVATIQRRFTLR